jgi:hypothetical protein
MSIRISINEIINEMNKNKIITSKTIGAFMFVGNMDFLDFVFRKYFISITTYSVMWFMDRVSMLI